MIKKSSEKSKYEKFSEIKKINGIEKKFHLDFNLQLEEENPNPEVEQNDKKYRVNLNNISRTKNTENSHPKQIDYDTAQIIVIRKKRKRDESTAQDEKIIKSNNFSYNQPIFNSH